MDNEEQIITNDKIFLKTDKMLCVICLISYYMVDNDM